VVLRGLPVPSPRLLQTNTARSIVTLRAQTAPVQNPVARRLTAVRDVRKLLQRDRATQQT
jgi:hypothetical protein